MMSAESSQSQIDRTGLCGFESEFESVKSLSSFPNLSYPLFLDM